MSRVNDWFFQKVSPYQLAVLRIVFAAISFLLLFRFQTEAIFHFSDVGWFPRNAPSWFYPQPSHWTPLFWSGDPGYVQFFFIFSMAASFFMLIGFCTPFAAPLTWIAILSIRSRNLTMTDGTEFILQFALMYLSFTDSGQVLSVDQRLGLRETLWRKVLPFFAKTFWPLRMIQLNLLVVYFVAGASKTLGTQFWDGSFISITLMNKNYARWDFSVLHTSALSIWLSKIITWCIPVWEFCLPFALLYKRTLKFAVWSGVLFHLGILIFMKLSYFPIVMIACYLTFLPASCFQPKRIKLDPDFAP